MWRQAAPRWHRIHWCRTDKTDNAPDYAMLIGPAQLKRIPAMLLMSNRYNSPGTLPTAWRKSLTGTKSVSTHITDLANAYTGMARKTGDSNKNELKACKIWSKARNHCLTGYQTREAPRQIGNKTRACFARKWVKDNRFVIPPQEIRQVSSSMQNEIY